MSETTKIEWTDATFNIAWGGDKVSAGCKFCYAERDSHRRGFSVWGPRADRRVFGEKHWNEPLRWVRKWDKAGHGRPMMIFTSSFADVFEDHPTIATERAKLWPLIRATPTALWQIVTKRPENFARFLPDDWGAGYPNVILMVTAEDQPNADRRVPLLLATPAALRGVSYEPALGPVDFKPREWLGEERRGDCGGCVPAGATGRPTCEGHDVGGLDWIIVGGESGPGARPFDVAWARQTIAACESAGAACFVKQLGARPHDGHEADHNPNGADEPRWWPMRDRKGGDWNEWPADLRVRQFPRIGSFQ